MAGKISVEQLARVRAALDAGEAEGDALARLGVEEAAWGEQERQLLDELDEACQRGDFQRVYAYQAAYQLASGRAPTPEPATLAATAPVAIGQPPQGALASFQRLPAPAVVAIGAPPTGASDVSTAQHAAFAAQPAVPFVVAPSASPPAASAVPGARIPSGTADFDIRAFGLPTTPFTSSSQAPTAPAPTTPVVSQGPSFTPAAPPAAGLPKTTLFVSDHAAAAPKEALPFQPGSPGLSIGVPRSVGPASSAAPRNPFPPPASEVAAASRTAIAFTQPPDSKATSQDALPFQSADQLMPIERYAEITALLLQESSPERTFARLGIDPAMWMSTVRSYAKRFAADPLMEKTFDVLVKRAQRNAR